MKTAEQWQEELVGETSIRSIQAIQRDALLHAALIAYKDEAQRAGDRIASAAAQLEK